MKNLLLASLTILFFSCSSDDFTNYESSEIPKDAILNPLKTKISSGTAEKGIDLQQHIKVKNYVLVAPLSLANQIISIVHYDQTNSGQKMVDNYILSTDTIIMKTSPVDALFLIVEESLLAIPLQENVKNYILNLNDLQGQSYVAVDFYITKYETAKHVDENLSIDEKNTILTISSISEAALYSEKERKDRDWETSTTSKH